MNDLLERVFTLTPRLRLALYAGAVLLLSLVPWSWIHAPAERRLADRQGRAEELERQHAERRRRAARLEPIRSEVRELAAALGEAAAELPDRKEIPDLLSTVSRLGRESGLEILSFRQRPENLHGFYVEVPVEMLMRGTYAELAEFFDDVGRLDRIVNVKTIALKSPVVTPERVTLDASCTVVTFRFISEEDRARAAAEKGKQHP